MKNLLIVIILVFLNRPIYRYLYKLNFKDDDEYDTNIKRVFTPNVFQNPKESKKRDYGGETRAIIYIFLCGGVTYLEWVMLLSLLKLI